MFLCSFFCPADHVPDWQPCVLLGMVEARSVNVKKTRKQENKKTTTQGKKKSKRLVGIIGCKDETFSWHSNGFPDCSNIGSTV